MGALLLRHGLFITLDPSQSPNDALLLRDGRIQAVGREQELQRLVDAEAEVLDLKGRYVLPGFIDPHLHFRALAESLVTPRLGPDTGVTDIACLQEKIFRESQKFPPGTWIRASGYDDTSLAEGRDPTRFDLDPVSPLHPVKLTHRSGHAHVLNSMALKLLQITRETPDPEGWLMERDPETGEPTGVFYGHGDPFHSRIPPLPEDLLRKGVEKADDELVRNGITTFQDASVRNDRLRWLAFREWKSQGLILSHVVVHLGWKGFEEYLADPESFGEPLPGLTLGGVKIVIDETLGRIAPEQRELNEKVLAVHRAGFQAVIHAIEEPAIEAALTAVEYAQKQYFRPDPRHRIEHASICPPHLAERIRSLGVLVVSHPTFLYYSGDRYLKTVPPSQFPYLYPLRTLLSKGVTLAAASDAPIVPPHPWFGIYSAVTRRSQTGAEILPEEKITLSQALALYTVGGAISAFEEKEKGTLTPGKRADLVVVRENPLTMDPARLPEIKVEMTLVNGKVVYPATEALVTRR